jgi:hypothetical protein
MIGSYNNQGYGGRFKSSGLTHIFKSGIFSYNFGIHPEGHFAHTGMTKKHGSPFGRLRVTEEIAS